MRLLLDVHHTPTAAEKLRELGHDVTAAASDPELRELDDEALLRAATNDGRAVVTEDAKDFNRIVRAWATADEHHAGVIYTSPRRFHRGSSAYPGDLIKALAALLADPPALDPDGTHWL